MKKLTPPTEKVVHQQVCDYMKLQYPKVIFTSDSSGARVSIGLRKEFARKRCNSYKIPDLLILHPSKGYHGLCIEIKKPGERITKRNGDYADEHIEAQAKALTRLKELGYAASFAVGFDEAVNIISDYLNVA